MGWLDRRARRRERELDRRARVDEAKRSRRTTYIATFLGVALTVLAGWLATRPWDNAGDAYRVTVVSDPDAIDLGNGPIGTSYITDQPISALPPLPDNGYRTDCVGRSAWATGFDGIEATTSHALVTVEATGDQLVRLTALELAVDSRADPPEGIHLTCGGKGERNEVTIAWGDLDVEPPTLSLEAPFNFDVTKDDSEVFLITATTLECDCLWHAELTVVVDGHEETVRIPESGSYRTASPIDTVDYVWQPGGWIPLAEADQPRPAPASTPTTSPPPTSAPLTTSDTTQESVESAPPSLDQLACLITAAEATELHGAPTEAAASEPQYSFFGETEILVATCNYSSNAALGQESFVPLYTQVFQAASPADLEAIVAAYEQGTQTAAIAVDPGPADQAVIVGDFYLAFVGTHALHVQAPEGADLESLGALASGRLAERLNP